MSIEVEIKAWVDDFDHIKSLLDSKYSFVKDYDKEDVYLKGIDSITGKEKEVRLRRVGNESIVTYKERSHIDKVEVNLEKEFSVDDSKTFLFIAEKLGYIPYIRKNKKGHCYTSSNITIELSHVDRLGDFIEIEYIVENEGGVDNATSDIFVILDELKIPREKIEDKFYVQMLNDLDKKNEP